VSLSLRCNEPGPATEGLQSARSWRRVAELGVRRCSRFVKHQLPTFLCLSLLFATSAHARLKVVSDPLAAYYGYLVAEHMQSGVSVVETDFDCDGRLDVAITTSAQGHSGADWFIYLRRPDDRFTQVGSVSTKANRFHIAQQKKGVGRLAVMQRAGPGGWARSHVLRGIADFTPQGSRRGCPHSRKANRQDAYR